MIRKVTRWTSSFHSKKKSIFLRLPMSSSPLHTSTFSQICAMLWQKEKWNTFVCRVARHMWFHNCIVNVVPRVIHSVFRKRDKSWNHFLETGIIIVVWRVGRCFAVRGCSDNACGYERGELICFPFFFLVICFQDYEQVNENFRRFKNLHIQ